MSQRFFLGNEAMPRLSAGLLMYRIKDGAIQVLLAHPGGPYFVNKDDGAWSIPKGEPDADEDLLVTAQREFEEETGVKPAGPFIPLKPIKQKSAAAGSMARLSSSSLKRSTSPAVVWLRPGPTTG
jgi:predicted NUDIX family NTP pyrophosphohydrolase